MPKTVKNKINNKRKNKSLRHNKQKGGRGGCIKTALFDNSQDLIKLNINSPNRPPWYFPNYTWPPKGSDGLMSQSISDGPQVGSPAPIGHSNNIPNCFIPVPRAPIAQQPVKPMEPSTLTEPGMPAAFEGPPPPRDSPREPGPPGPGAFTLGLEGIPVLPANQRPAQPIEILKDVVNRGTYNRDMFPAMVTSKINNSTCVANPNLRNQQSGGSKLKKYKKSLKKRNKNKKSFKKKN